MYYCSTAMRSWRTVRKWETRRRMNPDGFLFIKQPSQVCHLLSLPDSVRQEYFHHFFLRENARHTEQGRSFESRGTLFTSISERGRKEIRREKQNVLPKDKRKMGQWLCSVVIRYHFECSCWWRSSLSIYHSPIPMHGTWHVIVHIHRKCL